MSKKKYPGGIYFNNPSEKAPDFVIGKIAIHQEKLMLWLDKQKANDKGYIYLDVLNGREGPYCVVNEWRPRTEKEQEQVINEKVDEIPF